MCERQKDLGDLNAALNDTLSGIREIKAFTQEETKAIRVGHHIIRYRDSMLKALRLMAAFHPFIASSSSLGAIVIIYFGGKLALNQTLPVADLVAFFLYLEMFYRPVRTLSGVWEQVQEAMAGAERGLCQLVEQMLEAAGRSITVRHAYDGLEGLAAMHAQQPELVLLDLMIPGMDGFQVLEIMQGEPELMNAPVILLTGGGYVDGAMGQGGERLIVQRRGGLRPAEILQCVQGAVNAVQPRYETWLNAS